MNKTDYVYNRSGRWKLSGLLGIQLILALVISTLSFEGWALDPDKPAQTYLYRNFSGRDGVPQSDALTLLQSRDGYIWTGTHVGAARYNGRLFKSFDAAQHPDYVGTFVLDLLETLDGSLWFATDAGVNVLGNGDVKSYTSENGLFDGEAKALCEDTRGRVWVVGQSRLVSYVEDGVATTLKPQGGPASSEAAGSRLFNDVACGADGTVWFASNEGLYVYKGEKFSRYTVEHGLPNNMVRTVYQSSKGLLIGTDSGFVVLKGNRIHSKPLWDSFSSYTVSALLEDGDGNLWVGTDQAGLFVVKPGWVETPGLKLRGKVIRALMEDVEGNVWVGTRLGGIYLVTEPKVVTHIPHAQKVHAYVWSLAEDDSGRVWVAAQGGLVGYDAKGQRILPEFEELSGVPIGVLNQDPKGAVWIGTEALGIYRYSGDTFQNLSARYPELVGKKMRAFGFVGDEVFLGTRESGLYVSKEGQPLRHYDKGSGLGSQRVTDVVPWEDGRALILTQDGLKFYSDGELEEAWIGLGLPKVGYIDAFVDRDRNVWLGTHTEGLQLIRRGRRHALGKEQGLLDDNVFSILMDDQDNFWISCDFGVYKVSRLELLQVADGQKARVNAVLFGRNAGLATPECNGGTQNAGLASRDGHLWFGCADGAVVVDPQNITHNTTPPSVVLESAVVDGLALEAGSTLPPDPQRMEFEFAGLSFQAPDQVKFKYMLEGQDDDWSTTFEHKVVYTNLEDGDYVFRVTAANNDGVWNEEGDSLAFAVEAPFYLKWWFIFSLVLAIAGLITVYVRLRSAQVRRRTLALTDLSWKQTRVLLDKQVGVIRDLIDKTSKVSGQMETLMTRMQESSHRVASAAVETAATVSQLTVTGKTAESGAKDIVKTAMETESETNRSRDALERSIEVMSQFEGQSLQISDKSRDLLNHVDEVDTILNLVSEISEQSAVLSINASIEASKAGEYGVGFEVVAGNMQELAAQSKGATLDIARILSTIVGNVEDIATIATSGKDNISRGVGEIRVSGDIVTSLGRKMEDNSKMAGSIAHTIGQQQTGLDSINDAVAGFTANVDENVEISQAVALHIAELNQVVQTLLENMVAWETPDFYTKELAESEQLRRIPELRLKDLPSLKWPRRQK